jgi:hypothetical protein
LNFTGQPFPLVAHAGRNDSRLLPFRSFDVSTQICLSKLATLISRFNHNQHPSARNPGLPLRGRGIPHAEGRERERRGPSADSMLGLWRLVQLDLLLLLDHWAVVFINNIGSRVPVGLIGKPKVLQYQTRHFAAEQLAWFVLDFSVQLGSFYAVLISGHSSAPIRKDTSQSTSS